MSLPIRVRLTVWYGLLLATIMAALSTFIVVQLRTDLRRELDQELRGAVAELARTLADDSDRVEDPSDRDRSRDQREDFRDAAAAILPSSLAGAQLLDTRGRVLIRYGTVADRRLLRPEQTREAVRLGAPRIFTERLAGRPGSYRVRLSPAVVDGEPRLILLAHSMQRIDDAVSNLTRTVLVVLPAALLVTGLAAFWLASRALHPVQRITEDAEEIGIARLHERVAVPRSRDETQRLALTLNAMLERIESGVQEKHQMVADASHELRTPLAVMRSELDVTLREDTLPDPAREVLVSVREEVDRITRTVDNLLTMAQVDEGRLELLAGALDVGRLVQEVTQRLRPVAAAKAVSLVIGGESWSAWADGPRLSIALTNLVENAIAFSPEGAEVVVTTWRRAGEGGVTVEDDGPGIPAADQARLFDRFYRGPSHERRRGSGLGLAICRDIAHAHDGRVWVESQPGRGAAFSLALPEGRVLTPSRDDQARSTRV